MTPATRRVLPAPGDLVAALAQLLAATRNALRPNTPTARSTDLLPHPGDRPCC